jgi:hypothetical protein
VRRGCLRLEASLALKGGRPELLASLSLRAKKAPSTFGAIFNFDDWNEKLFSSLLERATEQGSAYATQQPSPFLSSLPMVRQTF